MLTFQRESNGDILIIQTPTDGTGVSILVPRDHWISAVLSTTKHGERPGDFHAWGSHHDGAADVLEGRRGGY